MMQELDASFDAALFVGYHSRAGSGGNPLAHTLSSSRVARMDLGGEPISEFHLNAYAGAMLGVPVVFVSGDERLCEDARALSPAITAVPVLRGVGAATVSLHPAEAEERIRSGVEAALRGDPAACAIELPGRFELVVRYREAALAHRMSFYPGARPVGDRAVAFGADDYFEVLRALSFLV